MNTTPPAAADRGGRWVDSELGYQFRGAIVMTFIMMVITSVIVGWIAQKWKGRTGAAWALISFLPMPPIWFILYFATSMRKPELYVRDEVWYALGIMVSGGVAIVMALVVATLPKRK